MSGKTGEFLACSGYPDCKFTSNFKKTDDGKIQLVEEEKRDEICPECQSPMVLRQGRGGPFLGCTKYPDCKGILPLSTGVSCPEDGCVGNLVVKRSKKGRIFYSCSRYPKCKFATWDPPVAHTCPQCQNPIMTEKSLKTGDFLVCPRKECGFRIQRDADAYDQRRRPGRV